ncbi:MULTISPECIES: ATP-binding protein [Flavobacterium]|uniref:ATP-binding protein n=1 Tax=Flavobacterium TaxID=237 RepID=UPI00211563F8|nr:MULTISPECIES: ATP-binding protein [Flavobacterium]UUF12458.1 ATP-binding protein [Flavobacterium panici]
MISISSKEQELIISDNGIGMQASRLEKILDQDYVSSRGTENEKGIGVGLQLVFNLAAKNNCRIKIESKEAKGTTVRIIFDIIRT